MSDAKRRVGALFFERFELLDIFGPLEMFGVLTDHFEVLSIGQQLGSIASTQGPRVVIDADYASVGQLDILLVPGGVGTRTEVGNPALLEFLQAQQPGLDLLGSICTGAALLARAGLLDGRRATTNKLSFDWVVEQGPDVEWVPEARWVEDGDVFTGGGVAAGIDMALAMIARLLGDEIAVRVAQGTEYEWHRDAGWDPFAKLAGLV